MKSLALRALVAGALLASLGASAADSDPPFEQLFTRPGLVTPDDGWTVRRGRDVSEPPKWNALWEVDTAGVLHGTAHYSTRKGGNIGSWLLSQKEYGDFILELDFKYAFGGGPENGEGGIGLRVPLFGEPAFKGMELQIADERYIRHMFPHAGNSEFTGALYLLAAPKEFAYIPGEWNHYRIELRGPKVKVWLNQKLVQDVDLTTLTQPAKRFGEGENLVDGTPGAQRPLKGHIGFQDLGKMGEDLMFRNIRIAELK